jgi:hypothetical protein
MSIKEYIEPPTCQDQIGGKQLTSLLMSLEMSVSYAYKQIYT